MNQSNYLQQSQHCPTCHKHYFDSHGNFPCISSTAVINLSDCSYCCAQKFIAEKNKELDGTLTPLGEALQSNCPRCSQRWIIHDCPRKNEELENQKAQGPDSCSCCEEGPYGSNYVFCPWCGKKIKGMV